MIANARCWRRTPFRVYTEKRLKQYPSVLEGVRRLKSHGKVVWSKVKKVKERRKERKERRKEINLENKKIKMASFVRVLKTRSKGLDWRQQG